MKKWLMMVMLIFIFLGLAGIGSAQAAGQGNVVPGFSGVYEVTVTTDQGLNQNASITIEDLKNGEVQVNYDYEGSPLGLVGEVSGQAEQGGAVCRFAVKYPGIVTAQAEFTIIKAADNYQLQGQGSGTYNLQGRSGQVVGQVTGTRISPLTPPSPAPLRIMTALAGLTGLLFIWVCFRVLKRPGQPPKSEA